MNAYNQAIAIIDEALPHITRMANIEPPLMNQWDEYIDFTTRLALHRGLREQERNACALLVGCYAALWVGTSAQALSLAAQAAVLLGIEVPY